MKTFSFPAEIDTVLDSLGDKQENFVKEAVIEKAQREGLLKSFDQLSSPTSQSLSVGARLNQRERVFLNGPADLSDRSTRKQIAHDIVDERHQSQQQPS
jgi:hypothetical protein